MGSVNFLQSCVLDGIVIEPWTITRFPLEAAYHAKLSSAATRHVVASLFEFDHGRTVKTSLPSFRFGYLNKPLCFFVFGAFPGHVPFAVTSTTDFGFTPPTLAVFPPRIATAGSIDVNICGFDPFTAAFSGAVDTVFGSILLKLLVPFDLEWVGKQLLHVFQRDVICSTAFGWHVLGIRGGHGKYSFEAIMTHAVSAAK